MASRGGVELEERGTSKRSYPFHLFPTFGCSSVACYRVTYQHSFTCFAGRSALLRDLIFLFSLLILVWDARFIYSSCFISIVLVFSSS